MVLYDITNLNNHIIMSRLFRISRTQAHSPHAVTKVRKSVGFSQIPAFSVNVTKIVSLLRVRNY